MVQKTDNNYYFEAPCFKFREEMKFIIQMNIYQIHFENRVYLGWFTSYDEPE